VFYMFTERYNPIPHVALRDRKVNVSTRELVKQGLMFPVDMRIPQALGEFDALVMAHKEMTRGKEFRHYIKNPELETGDRVLLIAEEICHSEEIAATRLVLPGKYSYGVGSRDLSFGGDVEVKLGVESRYHRKTDLSAGMPSMRYLGTRAFSMADFANTSQFPITVMGISFNRFYSMPRKPTKLRAEHIDVEFVFEDGAVKGIYFVAGGNDVGYLGKGGKSTARKRILEGLVEDQGVRAFFGDTKMLKDYNGEVNPIGAEESEGIYHRAMARLYGLDEKQAHRDNAVWYATREASQDMDRKACWQDISLSVATELVPKMIALASWPRR